MFEWYAGSASAAELDEATFTESPDYGLRLLIACFFFDCVALNHSSNNAINHDNYVSALLYTDLLNMVACVMPRAVR